MVIAMSMRSQYWYWSSFTSATTTATIAAGARFSIFYGGVGLLQTTKPPETTATQFVVIENFGCTPNVGEGFLQILINTTAYFLNPDGIQNNGVPGAAAPYPISESFYPSFNLIPIYILPGQVWDVIYFTLTGVTGGPEGAGCVNGDIIQDSNIVEAFVQYTLYDGADALIANKLLELGIVVKPENIDWAKRQIIEAQAVAPPKPDKPGYKAGQEPVEVM